MIRYFISDLHLNDKRPDLIRAFVQLSKALIARDEKAELYILGDFYEAWIGDDYQADWNTQIEEALAALSQSGIGLYFLHGNRDFLIGKAWIKRVGATLIQEQTLLSLDAGPILLTHGDEYCLEDTEYQAFRKTVRSPAWQEHILAMPLQQRIALAAQLRNDSKSMASTKSTAIMDVTTSAVTDSLAQHHCNTVIHGHTHRPNVHKDEHYQRFVLGDWDDFIWLASIEGYTYTQYKASVANFLQHGFDGFENIHQEDLLP
ncbi:UDP-2,3-diacylglucosamine diphosphatase [Marinomonas sp. M1K-6]|uniref:UDP-2,3-diacylglucosamine hydrolase n=1 Tax=Marinomonas profundi TaxID=2726122 RepID=A0A847R9X4_9GAMM|nr:UDP-2,3-diacylglucosamine diphosphatase [Marinomonas profundi]NLQ18846.1 UDP-2,3-diacylglucosamine diphosphatase [Marinomonas profundi]UDV02950.1 UDP-2,3-diacylglucosamine diphosphatase [Marinomonas profundi]